MSVILTTENYPDIMHDTLVTANGQPSSDYGDATKVCRRDMLTADHTALCSTMLAVL